MVATRRLANFVEQAVERCVKLVGCFVRAGSDLRANLGNSVGSDLTRFGGASRLGGDIDLVNGSWAAGLLRRTRRSLGARTVGTLQRVRAMNVARS